MNPKLRSAAVDLLGLGGAGLLAVGLWLVSHALCLIAMGVLMIALAALLIYVRGAAPVSPAKRGGGA